MHFRRGARFIGERDLCAHVGQCPCGIADRLQQPGGIGIGECHGRAELSLLNQRLLIEADLAVVGRGRRRRIRGAE